MTSVNTPLFTNREVQILELIAAGYTDKAIALRLRISTTTVATHVRRLYTRRGIHSRAAAVALWLGVRTQTFLDDVSA
jgi:DNA-binding NarL/FixJ family response regulator